MGATGRCIGCGVAVDLSAATPRITVDGCVELSCAPCGRGERPGAAVIASEPASRGSRPRRRATLGLAGSGLAALPLLVLLGSGQAGRAPALAPEPAAELDRHADAVDDGAGHDEPELVASVEPPPLPPIPLRDGDPLDEWLPTLRGWVHPVPGAPELVPGKPSRQFGAARDGTDRAECGRGHCGVDLDGERGQPVVAVAWGTVTRIQRDGRGRGGRYVRIEHPDSVFTSYFHLDHIAPGLAVGDEVAPGTPVGTLGRSGIHASAPHLHLALELPDGGALRYADPAPFLARATLLARSEVPELVLDRDPDAGAGL